MHIATQALDHGTSAFILTDTTDKYLLTNQHVFADVMSTGGGILQPAVDDFSPHVFGGVKYPKYEVECRITDSIRATCPH